MVDKACISATAQNLFEDGYTKIINMSHNSQAYRLGSLEGTCVKGLSLEINVLGVSERQRWSKMLLEERRDQHNPQVALKERNGHCYRELCTRNLPLTAASVRTNRFGHLILDTITKKLQLRLSPFTRNQFVKQLALMGLWTPLLISPSTLPAPAVVLASRGSPGTTSTRSGATLEESCAVGTTSSAHFSPAAAAAPLVSPASPDSAAAAGPAPVPAATAQLEVNGNGNTQAQVVAASVLPSSLSIKSRLCLSFEAVSNSDTSYFQSDT
eukprot:g81033.t1